MNLYECQEWFKQMYPGKKVDFSFDEKCHRQHDLMFTDGKPNLVHHVEYKKVKVTVEGMDPMYVPIAPHRENFVWADMKKFVNGKSDVHINQEQIDELKKLPSDELEKACHELARMSDLSVEKIKQKLQ